MHVPLAYPGAMAKVRWAVRCSATSKRTGRQCSAYAMTGGYVCWVHGGATPAVRAAAARRWEFAKMMRRIEHRSGPLVAAFMRAEFPAEPRDLPKARERRRARHLDPAFHPGQPGGDGRGAPCSRVSRPGATWSGCTRCPRTRTPSSAAWLPVPVNGRELHAGDAVCITGGATAIPRDQLEARAIAAGLRVTSAVSRKTRLVVAADPDTESTKARRARELGIPSSLSRYFSPCSGEASSLTRW